MKKKDRIVNERAWERAPARENTRPRWRGSNANPPAGAQARVWQALQKRRARAEDKPARRRLGWAMFAAGAALRRRPSRSSPCRGGSTAR